MFSSSSASILLALSILVCGGNAFRLDLTQHEVAVKDGAYDGAINAWNITKVLDTDADPQTNLFYTTKVYVGTPPQAFTVRIETASPFLWVPDAKCGSENCPRFCSDPTWCSYLCHNACCNKKLSSSSARWCEAGVQKFQSANSRTYRSNGTSFNVDWYVNPVDGFLGVDTLTLGDSLTIPAATFGQATSAIFDDESQNAKIYDGFLGLGFPIKRLGELPAGFEPPLITAQRTGIVKEAIWSLYLYPSLLAGARSNAGRIVYGKYDSEKCASDVKWVKTYDSDIANFALKMKSASFGRTKANAQGDQGWMASIDFTNRFAFSAAKSILDKLAFSVRAVSDGRGGYNIPCDAKIPPLTFEFSDGAQKFEVSSEELILKNPNGNACKLNVVEGGFLADPPLVIVGAPLMRSYCSVYDTLGNRVGFAKHL